MNVITVALALISLLAFAISCYRTSVASRRLARALSEQGEALNGALVAYSGTIKAHEERERILRETITELSQPARHVLK